MTARPSHCGRFGFQRGLTVASRSRNWYIVENMNLGDVRVDETDLVRTPINWTLSRRFICVARPHPTEIRLTRYGDSSTRPMGTVSGCLCGRSSTLTPPKEGM